MVSFLKRKNGWIFSLVLLCGFQFFFLPFIHFHRDDTHSHQAELTPHHHPGHFHSHELETLTHFIQHKNHGHSDHEENHSSESDEEHHHTDPFDDTESDYINLHKPKLVKGTSIEKKGESKSSFILTHSGSTFYIYTDLFPKHSSGLPKNYISRSPPSLFI